MDSIFIIENGIVKERNPANVVAQQQQYPDCHCGAYKSPFSCSKIYEKYESIKSTIAFIKTLNILDKKMILDQAFSKPYKTFYMIVRWFPHVLLVFLMIWLYFVKRKYKK